MSNLGDSKIYIKFTDAAIASMKNTSPNLMRIKAQRIRDTNFYNKYWEFNLNYENSYSGGCETLKTPNIFLFPSVLSLSLF